MEDRELIERLEALVDAATPGEWRTFRVNGSQVVQTLNSGDIAGVFHRADALLIAELKNAAPRLLELARAATDK